MSASASSHAPNGGPAQLAEPQPASNNGGPCPEVGQRAHEQEDAKQSALSSTHISPAMRIYRHALESIFAMLQLEDLSRALAVSRSWSAAIRSMKSINASIECTCDRLGRMNPTFRWLPPIHNLIASPLIRHTAAIHIKDKDGLATPLSSEALALLAQHAQNLTSLWCSLTLTPSTPLILPVRLTSLELALSPQPSAAEINDVLRTLAALPALQRLVLTLTDAAEVDLSLLAAVPALRDFTLENSGADLDDDQIAQVRSSLGHLQRINIAAEDMIRRFLQPPVTARWQDIGFIDGGADAGELLASLPTLTTLEISCSGEMPHVEFVTKLPLLTTLTMYNSTGVDHVYSVPPDIALASLTQCTGLTSLDVECGFNSAQFSTLLAHLTKLTKLKVRAELISLQCFASGPATQTLEELELYMLGALPLSELPHLFALKNLRSLLFWRCFSSAVDAATIDSLSPPCAALPSLTQFQLFSMQFGQSWETVNRTGQSFEWTQQRLTQ